MDETVGHYSITKELSADGEGAFFAGVSHDGQPVRIRRLAPHLAIDPAAAAAFLEQARRLAELHHRAINRIVDVGESAAGPYYVEESLEGSRTLDSLLASGPLAAKAALDAARDAAAGLAEAHRRGVVHARISPKALVLTERGAKLGGFAFALPGGDPSTEVGGEPSAYASPERCSEGRADPRADLWSLSAVLYAALAGKPPFEGSYSAALIYAILNEDPPPIAQLDEAQRPGVEALLAKALAKNPLQRHGHADELIAELNQVAGRPRPAAPAVGSAMQTGPPAASPAGPRVTGPLRRPPAATLTRPAGQRMSRSMLGAILGAAALVIAAAAGAWWVGSQNAPRRDASGRASLAVLPLRNLSPAADEDYLADGMTEELITSLAKISALRVISRTSVMQYKGGDKPPQQIAAELNVGYLVEGSVQRYRDRIRVNATLIDAQTGGNLWAESYDHDLTGVLALQSQAAREIASEIEVQLTPEERVRLADSPTVRAQSYEKYLRGRYLMNRRTPESLSQARELFAGVTSEDPRFAPAYAGLADAHILLSNSGTAPPDQIWPAARDAVETALELDPELAEGYATRALIRSFYEWRWDDAGLDYRTAIGLNPGDAVARQRYAVLLSRMGRHDEALREIEQARAIDPLSQPINHSQGVLLFMARRTDEALVRFQDNDRLARNRYRTQRYLGRCYLQLGRSQQAIRALEGARELSGSNHFMTAELIGAVEAGGDSERAGELLLELERGVEQGRYVSPGAWVVAYLGLGDRERALDWLDKAVEARSGFVVWLKVDPAFDPLRSDERFQRLLKRVNLS